MAEDVKLRGKAEAVVGGTLLYMSPEQLRAFDGHAIRLDCRSDVYALGVMLYELLTGRLPFQVIEYKDDTSPAAMATERDGPPASPRAVNPTVPWAVDAIVRKCLAPKPDDRYQTAFDLREDLGRELADRPLAFAHNPSVRERCRKWVRRHPTVTSTGTVAAVAGLLLAVGATGWWVSRDRTRTLEARDRYAAHAVAFRDAQAFADDRNNTLARSVEGREKLLAVLHRYGQTEEADPVALDRRDDVARLSDDDRRHLRDDLGETYYLLANQAFEQALVPDSTDKDRHLTDAVRWNRAAEQFGERIPRAVLRQRMAIAELRHDPTAARAAATTLSGVPTDSARDHYLSAYGLCRAGRYAEALPGLRAATQRDPENFSAWFVRGQAHLDLEQPEMAALCFGSCTALRKEFAPAWLNRGLAYARLRFFDQARDDYDRAIALRPDWSEAYLQRATVASLLGDHAAAERDLTTALGCGDATPRLFFLRASVRDHLGDAKGATSDRSDGLARTPADELSWVARGEVRMATDPTAALADVEQALRLNPLSALGLQLKAHLLAERLGRPEDAHRVLDQVVTAYPDSAVFRAGRGVLLARRGKYEQARQDARDALLRDGKPPNLYQVGCIFALTSADRAEDRAEAIRLVWQALKAGYGLEHVDADPDLNPIRADAEFVRVVAAAKSLHGRNSP
jgi:tetratricopeptide (TPR) repeat protein